MPQGQKKIVSFGRYSATDEKLSDPLKMEYVLDEKKSGHASDLYTYIEHSDVILIAL